MRINLILVFLFQLISSCSSVRNDYPVNTFYDELDNRCDTPIVEYHSRAANDLPFLMLAYTYKIQETPDCSDHDHILGEIIPIQSGYYLWNSSYNQLNEMWCREYRWDPNYAKKNRQRILDLVKAHKFVWSEHSRACLELNLFKQEVFFKLSGRK
jgi:hypothetical protein